MAARALTVLAAVMAAGAFAGIPRIETAGTDFKLDGRLDDAAWAKSVKLGDLVEIRTPDAPPPQNATTVWAFYDAGWIVEAKIPFRIFAEADFGFAATTPAKGDVIRINCGRYASVLGETTALARGRGFFHTVFPEFTCDGWELGDIRLMGYWPRAVLQVGDEPWSEKQQRAIRETVANMKARYGEIPPVVTAGAVRGKTNLDGSVDIWCPQVPQYVAADYAGMDRTKERLWLYQCLFKQDYPSFQIDRPSAEPRINGLVCRKCGAEGFLYWSSVQWTSSDMKSADYKSKKANPWVQEEWGFPIPGCPGDGCFVYPTKDGVVPSLRRIWPLRRMVRRRGRRRYAECCEKPLS